jgi:hypothetical protein
MLPLSKEPRPAASSAVSRLVRVPILSGPRPTRLSGAGYVDSRWQATV